MHRPSMEVKDCPTCRKGGEDDDGGVRGGGDRFGSAMLKGCRKLHSSAGVVDPSVATKLGEEAGDTNEPDTPSSDDAAANAGFSLDFRGFRFRFADRSADGGSDGVGNTLNPCKGC